MTPELIADCRSDLLKFTEVMFKARKGVSIKRNWHQDEICNALERVVIGQSKRLIINVPPRSGKTEFAVINFIAWCMGNWPDSEFIHASYSNRLATNNTFNARTVMQHEVYAEIFGTPKIRNDSNAKDEFRTEQGGVVYATGNNGSITGYGAGKMRSLFGGLILIDDPHKAGEANSDVMRQNVIDWFSTTMESRKNNPDTPIIIIMQRLHENDLSGFLLGGGNGEKWDHINIPAINDGVSFWPEQFPIDDLRRMEASDSYRFAGQYMQQPAPIGGGIFKTDWWKYYRVLPAVKRIIQSWDTAFQVKTSSDYTVCTTWAECQNGYYLIDLFKQKLEFPELKRAAVSLHEKHKPHAVLVEDKASGQSLLQELRRDTKIPLVAIKVDTDKISRAFAVTPLIESGRVYIPEGAPWLPEFIANLGMFPNAAHDDDVDSVTQALNYLARGGGSTGLLDYYRSEVEKMREAR
jgi:predicted phage terminase large subunit-like protein